VGIGGGAVDLAPWKEEERGDRRGPHGGDRREKRRHGQNAQSRREGVVLANTPRRFGLAGLSGAVGRMWGRCASWAGSQEKIQTEFAFQFQGIWKFGKTWTNSTSRFIRNLDMGIFSKFF
jgi:hypothetical protein